MARDRSKLPSIMAGGPPELVSKKEKDWKKVRWQSEQARLARPKEFLIQVDVVNTYSQLDLRKKFPRLFFEESNNQLFISTTAWKVTGPKKELIEFLTSDIKKMKTESIVGVYPELK
jgi:hypothetical protein